MQFSAKGELLLLVWHVFIHLRAENVLGFGVWAVFRGVDELGGWQHGSLCESHSDLFLFGGFVGFGYRVFAGK